MIAIRCDYLYDVNGLCFILLLQSHCCECEYKALIQQVRNIYCIYCISQKTSGVLRLMPCFISFTETLASHMAFTLGIYHFSTTILLVFSTMGRRTFRCTQYSKQTKQYLPLEIRNMKMYKLSYWANVRQRQGISQRLKNLQ